MKDPAAGPGGRGKRKGSAAGADDVPLAQPLSGLRVLDLSQVMAGPFCCMLLGDMGADVIKVEPPEGGDQSRKAMGFKLKGDDSLGFINMNRNKRSIALNLKSQAGLELFRQLAATADIVVENYRPGVTARLGIDYPTLREINPRIVYASISGFGQTGPWSERPGFDLIAQAMSGVMSITGHPGGPPAKAGVPFADIGCALFALYGILSAIIGRSRTGEGQYIDASLFEAAIAFSVWDVAEYWGTGRIPGPLGTAHRMGAPYQGIEAKDGWFIIGANNARLWKRLAEALDRPELLTDPRFVTVADRLANRPALVTELETFFKRHTVAESVDLLLAAGIPAGPILNYAQSLGSAHAAARGIVMDIDHPVEGSVKSIGFPVKLSRTPQKVRRHPPLLGEHTEEVLGELGVDARKRAALRRRGAFAA